MGNVAPKTATSPLGTNCSDQKMTAQGIPMLNNPAVAAAAIVRRSRGKGRRSASARSVSRTATATARSSAKTKGGTDATPTAIAAHVEPQSRIMTTYAASTVGVIVAMLARQSRRPRATATGSPDDVDGREEADPHDVDEV